MAISQAWEQYNQTAHQVNIFGNVFDRSNNLAQPSLLSVLLVIP